MKNQSLGMKWLMAAVTVGLLLYFGFQGARYYTDPLSITLAYPYQVENSVSLSGYVVREERVLQDESGGLLRLLRREGERVSEGGAVAAVYADQASLDRQAEIDSLDSRIEQLRYAQEAAQGVEVTQRLDSQIRQNIRDYRAALEADRFHDAEKQAAELRGQVMKRDYTVSGTEDLTAQIRDLQLQRQALQSQAARSVRRVTAPEAGLYSAVVDGYETVLTPASLESLTPSALLSLQPELPAGTPVGKLVLGDEWYYVAAMSAAEARELETEQEELRSGETLYLRFQKGVERDLPVELAELGPEENGRVAAVFRGNTLLAQLTLLRQQSAQVLSGGLEGLRVPREALRVDTRVTENEDGTTQETQVQGVYCLVGREARFKPVEILYSNNHFALVRPDVPDTQEILRLRAGDEVIVQAKNLYDGKVVG
ncbi:MAG: hypothetical protein HFG09_08790 [Oscillibacter sp.]|nr:hypothetical protein [Oscillibacter sp.]